MIEAQKIYLCKPNSSILTILNGVQTNTVSCNKHTKDYYSLAFNVDRHIDIDGILVESCGYNQLHNHMELLIPNVGYFQIQEPTTHFDGDKEIKSVIAYSVDKEFEDKDYVGLKINTGESDSLEYLAKDNINELGFAKNYVTFYNEQNPELSLMNFVISKVPGWSIGYIDPLLKNIKLQFNESSVNMYGFLNSIVAPKAECIFVFDILNRKINAYSKHSIDFDTNIFIGLRNLINQIDINIDEDSIATRFNVRGDSDLDIREVNFGEQRIFDISYYLNENYMSADMITKIKAWLKLREDNRNAYIEFNRQLANIQTVSDELIYKVPNDADNYSQWDTMEKELLNKNLVYYQTLLESLQLSVDANPSYENPIEKTGYLPWKKSDGAINHDLYLEKLKENANGYGSYYTYYEVLTYIIPNIEIAINNLGLTVEQKRNYILDYETNWELYGIEELKGKKQAYESQLKSISAYSIDWTNLTDEEKLKYPAGKDVYDKNRNEYKKIQNNISEIDNRLNILNTKLTSFENSKKSIQSEIEAIRNKVALENAGFSPEELLTINKLFIDKDYTNNNILTTSVDTTLSTIDVKSELLEDAKSKISEFSQPQYKFSISIDNLLEIDEFKNWKEDLELLRFVRLGIRDDYFVKLRIIGITWNPCEKGTNITLEFSNMITSRSGRSDINDVLDTTNNTGSKNSIGIGSGNSTDEKKSLSSLLQIMTKSQLFNNAVTNITNANIDSAMIGSLISDYAKILELDVSKITGDEASFKKFFGDYLDIDHIVANSANFKELDTYIANLKRAIIGTSSTETGIVFNLTSDNTTLNELFVKNEIASKISVADLRAHSATTELITLISKDGQPSIAFKDATQQFYDTNGHVRVQIGQDNSGNFNFIVRGEDGTTALFDSTGIKKDAIPNGLIVNNMIGDNTIAKNKLNFPIVKTDENGKVNIMEILDGNGNEFGISYTEFKEETTNNILDLFDNVTTLSNMLQSVELTGNQVFIEDDNGISPSSITIAANTKNGLVIDKWYIDGVENVSYVSSDKMSITIPSSYMNNKKSIVIKVEGIDKTKYDIFTIYKVIDGSDAYTVIISSNNGTNFKIDSNVTSSIATCTVYKGNKIVEAKSYKWMCSENNGTWKQIGTKKSITLPLSASIIKKSLYCEVTV